MNKQVYFLSSLPRTGSTLLASLLNQHPKIHASGTSALLELLTAQSDLINHKRTFYDVSPEQEMNIYKAIFNSYYNHIEDKEFIFDKHRSWPNLIIPIKKIGINPKIIITLRPISEIITSYITLIDKNPSEQNLIDSIVINKGMEINTLNRAMVIWSEYIAMAHAAITNAIKAGNMENMYFIQYKDIVNNPHQVLSSICEICGIPEYDNYDFDNIKNTQKEMDDSGWKIKDLHKIRPELKIESNDPKNILGEELTEYFDKFNIFISNNK